MIRLVAALTFLAACSSASEDGGDDGTGVAPPDSLVQLADATSKLGPSLVALSGDPRARTVPVDVRNTNEGRAVRVFVEAHLGRPVDFAAVGAARVRRYGDVYTAYVPVAKLIELAEQPGVRWARAARKLEPHLDASVPVGGPGIELSPPASGKWGTGVLVGIVDTGMDVTHADFTDGAGAVRIIDAWDQTAGPKAYSGDSYMSDSPNGNYANNKNNTVTIASPVDLSGHSGCSLDFQHRYEIESGFDYGRVFARVAGGSWVELAAYTGYQFEWGGASFSLGPYEGGDVEVRFIMDTDMFVVDQGWMIDDLAINCSGGSPATPFFDDFEGGFGNWSSTGSNTWDIQSADITDPSAGGNMDDTNGHGTHVGSIAAGLGVEDPSRDGVAYGADIAAVATTFWDADIVEGVEHVFQVAASRGQPSVVNLSLGGQAGPHDGRDPMDRAMDALTGPGRIIVASAGNSGDTPIHVPGTVTVGPGSTQTVRYDNSSNVLAAFDLWHDSPVGLNVRVTGGSVDTGTVPPGMGFSGSGVTVLNYTPDTTQPTNLIYVETSVGSSPSDWQIHLSKTSNGDPDADFDLWNFYTSGTTTFRGDGTFTADADSTIGSPGSALKTISVGATVTKDYCSAMNPQYCLGDVGDLAVFSSRGPLIDGRTLDISAPGSFVFAARSSDSSGSGEYAGYAGTSQAAPHITGLAAIALAADPMLGTEAVRSLLAESADTASAVDPPIGSIPSNDWGYGKADGNPFVSMLQDGTPTMDAVSYGPAGAGGNTTLTARGGAFTSTRSGSAAQKFAYQWQHFSDGLWRNIPYANYRYLSPDQFSSGDTLRVVATPVEREAAYAYSGRFFGRSVVSSSISVGGGGGYVGYTPEEQWNLISIPTTDDDTVLSSFANPLWEWDEVTQTYAEATSVVRGRGYFVSVSAGEGQMTSGGSAPPGTDYTVGLSYTDPPTYRPGRHLIGNPFDYPIYWQHLLVDGESVLTSSKVQGYYYADYHNLPEQYQIYDIGSLDGKIFPWQSFWIIVFEPVTLTIPASQPVPVELAISSDVSYVAGSPMSAPDPGASSDPGIARPGRPDRDPARPDDWQVQIQAFSGAVRDDYNYIGLNADAHNSWDRLDVLDPGTLGATHVVLSVDRSDRSFRPGDYCRDIQKMRRHAVWPVSVRSNGLSDPVTLAWQSPPAGWQLALEDETTGDTIDMTGSTVYSFTPLDGEAERRFAIRAKRAE